MQLSAVTIQLYRNFVEKQRIEIESDVTCLVGKNESGKTTILTALHRLKPANGEDPKFDLTTEYPRWRLARDRRSETTPVNEVCPVTAEFTLEDADRADLADLYEVPIPAGAVCIAWRTYGNVHGVRLQAPLESVVVAAAETARVPDDDIAKLDTAGSLAELVASAKAIAKEYRDTGDSAAAKPLTAFAGEASKYEALLDDETVQEEEQVEALWARVPEFFYFSNYDTLPGVSNLTELATKIKNNQELTAQERTVVALLAHAGEEPEDFLDDDYDSRKAELQSASFDLSQRVFTYWKQNTDLDVVFDTDNKVIATQPHGHQVANRYLHIELRDARHGGVQTNFDTRSAGFQWFFSFFAAFSRYQDAGEHVVVLLDEPGTSLHGDAQNEFVDYIFNELGRAQQTIYTTHSQHMVDPARYEKLRAVHDRATRENPDLGVEVTLPSLTADRATLLPIESALGYSVSRHLFLGSGQHLAVEGSGDFVYLQRFTEHLTSQGKAGLDPRLAILSVGGLDNMPAFVAILGRRLKVSALVDGDKTSSRLSKIKAAAKDNGVPERAIVAVSEVDGMPTNADIEDLFTTADYLRLYNGAFSTQLTAEDLAPTTQPILKKIKDHAGGRDFDHAQPAHWLTQHCEEFFATVDEQTIVNFAALFELLNGTVQD